VGDLAGSALSRFRDRLLRRQMGSTREVRRVGSEARIGGEAGWETQAWPARTRVGGPQDHVHVASSVWREVWRRPQRDFEWRRRQRQQQLLLLLALLRRRRLLLLLLLLLPRLLLSQMDLVEFLPLFKVLLCELLPRDGRLLVIQLLLLRIGLRRL